MKYPRFIIQAKVSPVRYPITAMYHDEEEFKENLNLFKDKGLIHNPDYWMSELNPPYLKPKEIWVLEFKEAIKSPKEGE